MKVNYYEYLKSDEWRIKRNIALDKAGYKCQLCYSGKRLEVHHRTYKRLGNELSEDLTVLCHDCHERFSRHQSKKKKKRFHKENPEVRMIKEEIERVGGQMATAKSSEFLRLRSYKDALRQRLKKVPRYIKQDSI